MDNTLKIIYGTWTFAIVSILFLQLILASPDSTWVYQEDANATVCEGTWHASYPCSATYDGNWATQGLPGNSGTSAYVYFNYTKPAGALSSSLWKVRDFTATINLTIPLDCWDYDANKLLFKGRSKRGDPVNGVDWLCFDGNPDWLIVRDIATSYYLYEEAMWWNISEIPVDTCTCAGLNENWEIDMSDYCNITEACDLGTGTLSFTGAGITTCNAEIKTTNLGDPGSTGLLSILADCIIWVI